MEELDLARLDFPGRGSGTVGPVAPGAASGKFVAVSISECGGKRSATPLWIM